MREWATVVPLLAAIVFIGVYPQPLLSATRVASEDLIQRVARKAPAAALPAGATPPAGAAQAEAAR